MQNHDLAIILEALSMGGLRDALIDLHTLATSQMRIADAMERIADAMEEGTSQGEEAGDETEPNLSSEEEVPQLEQSRPDPFSVNKSWRL